MTRTVDQIVNFYAIFFSIGALTHVSNFVVRGWRPYGTAPLFFETFWTSIAVIDVVVICLLMSKYRVFAVWFALIWMSIVFFNNSIATAFWELSEFGAPLIVQGMFLGFIVGSVGFVLKEAEITTQQRIDTAAVKIPIS